MEDGTKGSQVSPGARFMKQRADALRALAPGVSGFAGFVEGLLSGILGVGMQQGRLIAREVVVQPHRGELGEPVALSVARLAIDAVVGDERAGIDRSAGSIEGVGDDLGKIARNDLGADHGRTLAMCFGISILPHWSAFCKG